MAVFGLLSQPVGIVLGILGLSVFFWELCSIRTIRRKLNLEKSVDDSKVVWGLWHTGARIEENDLMETGTSIKRILLFDYCNRDKLTELTTRGTGNRYESNLIDEIKRITKKALLLKDDGVEVRWYREPMPYSISIYELDNDKVNSIDDFGKRAFLHIEFLLTKVRRDKRPNRIITKESKHWDEKQAFVYYVEEFTRIWDMARPINTERDMDC